MTNRSESNTSQQPKTNATSQRIVIAGGTVVSQGKETVADVAIESGVIVEVGSGLRGDVVLDATDCFVSSGFVDLHTH